jgi:Ca2+-binding EF-hand superfamily protein
MSAGRWLLPAALAAVVAALPPSWSARLSADDARPGNWPLEADAQDIIFLGPTRPILIRLHITIDAQPFRRAWQARFDELFALEDRDSDGRLDFDQARAVVRDMNGAVGQSPASNLKEFMAEGTIGRAQLADYAERTLAPFVLRPRGVIGQGAALALFPLLDTDRDGRLSAAELAAAEGQLVERDFDDNGVITPFELILDPKAIAAASDPTGVERDLDPNETPVLAIDAATTPALIAERLLNHYDRDRDGRLATAGAPPEIQLPPALMGRLDADGDAVLSRDELLAVGPWRPDLELSFALGQADVRGVRARRSPPGADGLRVRRKLLGGYDLDLGEAEIDFDRNNRDPRQADLVSLRTYDRDNNEYIDLAEARAAGFAESTFKAMDVDGDGKVFKGELSSFMTRVNEAAAARLHLIIRDLGRDLFSRLDIDSDGLLSPRDLREARAVLDVDDKNADRMLGFDEVPARLEFELVRGVDEQVESDPRMMRRVVRPTTQAETSGPTWFRKMDRNNDGDLSPQEFLGPRSAFDRLDADGDGLVNRVEAEAAEKK